MRMIVRTAAALFTTAALAVSLAPAAGAATIRPTDDWAQFSNQGDYNNHDGGDDVDSGYRHGHGRG